MALWQKALSELVGICAQLCQSLLPRWLIAGTAGDEGGRERARICSRSRGGGAEAAAGRPAGVRQIAQRPVPVHPTEHLTRWQLSGNHARCSLTGHRFQQPTACRRHIAHRTHALGSHFSAMRARKIAMLCCPVNKNPGITATLQIR